MKKKFLLIIVFIVFISSFQSISSTQNQNLLINLDYHDVTGCINHYGDINCGPIPNHDVVNGADLTSQYQQIGIDFIRTHDFSGPTDISTIFPDFSKDPTLPSSYNFTSSDYYITNIIDAGCQVFYRLGESASTNTSLREPPADFEKWATICKHVVMHYNDGWADGYHYNITHWEIWNEPDLSGFWNGTIDQYYDLYKTTAETLKTYDPSLKIGGPCTSSIYNENFTTKFLDYVVGNQIPLDFYTWHMYTKSPYDLYIGSCYIRQLLDAYGLEEAENINTEWNMDILSPQRDKDNAFNAAFTACALTTFLDGGLDYGFRYRGTGDNNRFTKFIGFDLALFSHGGLFKTPALTYLAFQYLTKDTPNRIATPLMDAEDGMTYIAGISENKESISIIISNYNAQDQAYTLLLDSVPWTSSYKLIHYLIDDENHFEITEETDQTSSELSYENTIKTSSVHFIRITNSSIIPEEGPAVYEIPFLLRLKFLDPIRALVGIILMIIFFG